MRGILMPLSTTSIPASARIVSNSSGNFPVPVPDQVAGLAVGVLEVHDEIPRRLHDPGGGRVRGHAQDPDAPASVLDEREHLQPCPGTG